MPEEHKSFVQEWNAKVAHGEDTSQINVPSGISILPPRNKWAHKARRLAEEAKTVPITPSPLQTTGKRGREEQSNFGRKRINFSLDNSSNNEDE